MRRPQLGNFAPKGILIQATMWLDEMEWRIRNAESAQLFVLRFGTGNDAELRMKKLEVSRRGICTVCHKEKRLYGTDRCRPCYQLRKREAFLTKGIDFPKRMCIRPREWVFSIQEEA